MANTLTALARNELGAVQAIRDQQKCHFPKSTSVDFRRRFQ